MPHNCCSLLVLYTEISASSTPEKHRCVTSVRRCVQLLWTLRVFRRYKVPSSCRVATTTNAVFENHAGECHPSTTTCSLITYHQLGSQRRLWYRYGYQTEAITAQTPGIVRRVSKSGNTHDDDGRHYPLARLSEVSCLPRDSCRVYL